MIQQNYHLFQGPMGWIGLLGSSQGLKALTMKPTLEEALEEMGSSIDDATADPGAFSSEQACLERYFRGDIAALDDIKLDLSDAPPFFRAAWDACRAIPAGETRSYTWLAEAAGNPRASRAAGQSMARNRVALVIPCHRVIGSSGDLHGYGAGGLTVKAKLLEMERTVVSPVA